MAISSLPVVEMDATLVKLRSLVQDCMQKHMYSSAIFYADKLVTMSKGLPEDVFVLAEAYFLTKQYRRAFNCLKHRKLHTSSPRFRLVAGQCQAELKQWDECLAILGDGNTTEQKASEEAESAGTRSRQSGASTVSEVEIGDEAASDTGPSTAAAICYLRGKVFDAQENHPRALHWYMEALRRDSFCYEAFERLIDTHMLTSIEEKALLDELSFRPEDIWLKDLYLSKLKKYDDSVNGKTLKTRLDELEHVHGLEDNTDVLVSRADAAFYENKFQQCLTITTKVLQQDPYETACLPLHIASLVELRRKNDLYYCAHRLVEDHPEAAVSWFAVGCYYLLVSKLEAARRYFSKATSIDQRFAPAWIGFGNAFAAQDESDQAMAAYRTASRLFPGCHLPLLYIGMEYVRTNNVNLADQLFKQAKQVCPSDPLVHNELGAVCYLNKDWDRAMKHFEAALALATHSKSEEETTEWCECILVNLGHVHRKLKEYDKAIELYSKALRISPRSATTYSALGFAYHLQGRLDLAVEHYHKALGLKAEDTFTTDVLQRALDELFLAQDSIR